jgi:hypothetical protein
MVGYFATGVLSHLGVRRTLQSKSCGYGRRRQMGLPFDRCCSYGKAASVRSMIRAVALSANLSQPEECWTAIYECLAPAVFLLTDSTMVCQQELWVSCRDLASKRERSALTATEEANNLRYRICRGA